MHTYEKKQELATKIRNVKNDNRSLQIQIKALEKLEAKLVREKCKKSKLEERLQNLQDESRIV